MQSCGSFYLFFCISLPRNVLLHILHLMSLSWLLSMGNVLAASSPSPPPPVGAGPGLLSVPAGFTMPAVSPVSSASSGQQESEPPLPNPGAFEEFHRKCKGEPPSFCHSSLLWCEALSLKAPNSPLKHNQKQWKGRSFSGYLSSNVVRLKQKILCI